MGVSAPARYAGRRADRRSDRAVATVCPWGDHPGLTQWDTAYPFGGGAAHGRHGGSPGPAGAGRIERESTSAATAARLFSAPFRGVASQASQPKAPSGTSKKWT